MRSGGEDEAAVMGKSRTLSLAEELGLHPEGDGSQEES